MKKKLKKVLSILLSFIIFTTLYYYIDIQELKTIYQNISLDTLLVAFTLYGISYIFRATRFIILLTDKSIYAKRLVPIVYIHGLYNRTLPARSGELSFIYYTNKFLQVEKTKSLFALLYARIYDLLTLLLLFFITIPFVLEELTNAKILVVFSTLILLGIIILLVFLSQIIMLINKLMLSLKITRGKKIFLKISEKLEAVQCFAQETNKLKNTLGLLFVSIMNWICIFSVFYVLINGFLDIKIHFIRVIFGATFANVSNVLPVSAVGGFGTMEAGWTLGFSLIGLERSVAITTGIAVNMFTFLSICLYGSIGLIINKFINKEEIRFMKKMGDKNETHHTNTML